VCRSISGQSPQPRFPCSSPPQGAASPLSWGCSTELGLVFAAEIQRSCFPPAAETRVRYHKNTCDPLACAYLEARKDGDRR